MQLLRKTILFVAIISTVAIFADSESVAANQTNSQSSTATYDQGYSIGDDQLTQIYNAPARIDVKGSWDFFFTGTYLLWEARERGLDFVRDMNGNSTTQATLDSTSYPIHHIDFEYKSGFKAGAGMNWEHDDWTTYVEYMYFHNNYGSPNYTYNFTTSRGVSTWWPNDGLTEDSSRYLQHIWSTWNLNMDILDFKLIRAMYRGNHLNLKPFAGVRGGWIDQNFHVAHQFYGDTLNRTFWVKATSKSWLVGPRFGLDGNWIFGAGFSLFGNISASLLYQKFGNTYQSFYYYDTSLVTAVYRNLRNFKNNSYITPNLDMIVGFDWGTYFAHDKWHFSVNAGYELEIYWNQNTMHELAQISTSRLSDSIGNLFLFGLTASARIDF